MKRIIAIFLMLLLLCACKPTPDEPIVMQKDQELTVEKAKEEIPNEERSLSLKDRLGVPDRYQYDYQKGYVTVEADAEISIPEGEIPIIRVFPDNFDQATASRLWDTLIGDMPMYQYDTTITKGAIKKQMEYLVKIIDGEISQEDVLESVEEAQAELSELQKQYANAPETVSFVPVDASLKTAYVGTDRNLRMARYTYVSGTSMETGDYFQLVNNLNNTEPITVQTENGEGIKQVRRNAYVNYGSKNASEQACDHIIGKYEIDDLLPEDVARSFAVTPRDAFSQAQQLLQSAGLTDFSVDHILLLEGVIGGDKVYAYRVTCSRNVRGIPCLSAVGVPDASNANDVYRPVWNYEQLVILIGRNGISSFSWNSPYAEGDVLTEQTKLLPFSEIQAIAEKMLPIVMAAQADGDATDKTEFFYHIDRVQLGLWRVCEYNDVEKGLLMPVWGFYALTKETSRFGETMTYYSPLLLINAVDGSIIDPTQGY